MGLHRLVFIVSHFILDFFQGLFNILINFSLVMFQQEKTLLFLQVQTSPLSSTRLKRLKAVH